MKNDELLSKDWCEIVFEGRKRDYGAYVLRREAGQRYRYALGIVFLLVVCFMVLPLLLKGFVDFRKYEEGDAVCELEVLKIRALDFRDRYEVEELEARPEQKRLAKGVVRSIPQIVDVVEPPKPQGITEDEAAIGEMLAQLQAELQDMQPSSAPKAGADAENALTPLEVVEQMPEFPGGISSLMRWLDRHVKYPASLVRRGVKGDLEVSFFVDRKGKVRDAFVSKPLHPQLDSLVLKVIQKMPKWKPARIGDKVEIVQISIPIHFEK